MTSAERSKKYRESHPGKHYQENKLWRYNHPDMRYLEKKRYYNKTSFAINGGQRYTYEEIQLVLNHNITDTELAIKLGRSVASIQKARWRYRKDV